MPPALADISVFPADGVTGKLRRMAFPIILTLPEDCSTIPELERLASTLELSLDEFISRAVITYADEVEHDLANRPTSARGGFPPDGSAARRRGRDDHPGARHARYATIAASGAGQKSNDPVAKVDPHLQLVQRRRRK
jgi:hypothetical protein